MGVAFALAFSLSDDSVFAFTKNQTAVLLRERAAKHIASDKGTEYR